jgi:hypothetical protein
VWLPVQISKLTDREGSYAQRFLQAISYQLYKNINLPKKLQNIWDVLLYPQQVPKINISLEKMNYFDVPENWLTKRIKGLISEIDTIISIDKNDFSEKGKIKSSRYLPTLKHIPLQERREIIEWLSNYKIWLSSRS